MKVSHSASSTRNNTISSQTGSDDIEARKETFASLLTRDAKVTEEQLFAVAVTERLESTEGFAAADTFRSTLRGKKATLRSTTGSRSVEQASEQALDELVLLGVLNQATRDSIHQAAFQIAQIDDNKAALFDGRGPDKAVLSRDAAIELAATQSYALDNATENSPDDTSSSDPTIVDAGVETSQTTPVSAQPPTTPESGNEFDTTDTNITEISTPPTTVARAEPNQFSWQPDRENNTVTLRVPEYLFDTFNGISVESEDGTTGTISGGSLANGFSFSLGSLTANDPVMVTINLISGNSISYKIDEPGIATLI